MTMDEAAAVPITSILSVFFCIWQLNGFAQVLAYTLYDKKKEEE
jgi:hypothetical protein